MIDHFILVGQTPVACDLMEWAEWFGSGDRRVALTEVGRYQVYTVFLGLDHIFSRRGPPLLFETMIFLRDTDSRRSQSPTGMEWRYPTWLDAERGHEEAVKLVENTLGISRREMLKSVHKSVHKEN